MPRQYQTNETRRRQVAVAALPTIADEGVHGFTTKAIAARVGITDGTLFRHFSSKSEIVLEALKLLRESIDRGLVSNTEPKVDLEHFFRDRAAFVGSEGSVGRLIFSEGLMHLAGPEGQEKIRDWRRRSIDFLRPRLHALSEQGALRVNPDAASMLIQGALLTFAMSASLREAPSPPI